ncbi:unnamed protein product (macronuclear) [Paramecium tetraurelia]|uniref:Myb-like DNA-binding domain containing protein n=1 Tax=Paramecium tetraurelia TaxID=5888 RepID=A0DSC3_PARTE|nr:uncharacterized protein GSPATT00019644001 [Paramecium tetraurelia]CAK85940.1 unnamed protein product [Paramecium tetraurelia]|eukprot:XP_001453337.1 hypothetical protein (macronuclear) [Paramecium tetraurelia strain d4-2]
MSVASNSRDENEFKENPIETKFTWTTKCVEKLKELHVLQQGNWKSISSLLNGPTPLECMFKWQQLHPDSAPSRQLWSPEEDQQLKELVQKFGKKWSKICTVMNWRTGKQVRERYLNQLQGTINQDKWTEEEDKLILKLYKKFGTKWSYISSFLDGRPENMVKNRFYANLKRRFQCDLGDSDDEDFEEESQNSSDEEKSNLQRRRRLQKGKKEPPKIKKVVIQDEIVENFQRMTRSKNHKSNDESLKQDSPNEDQNNENNSGLQHVQSSPSYNTHLGNQINIKEENQLKCDHFNNNPSIIQQAVPQVAMIPSTVSPLIFNSQFVPSQQNPLIYPQHNLPIINTQQFKQTQIDRMQMSYSLNQMTRLNFVNPFFEMMQQQQLLNYQIPIQSQYSGQIDQITQWAEFYKIYNNQMLQKHLQP